MTCAKEHSQSKCIHNSVGLEVEAVLSLEASSMFVKSIRTSLGSLALSLLFNSLGSSSLSLIFKSDGEKETTLSDRILEATITRFLSKIKSSDFELETKTVFVKTLSLPKFETLLEIEDISFSSARQIVSLPGMVLDCTRGSACEWR